MRIRRAAGLVLGYGLLGIALLAVVNGLQTVALGLLGALAFRPVVFVTMASLGAALVVGTGGVVVLQRSGGGTGYGTSLAGRVLGP